LRAGWAMTGRARLWAALALLAVGSAAALAVLIVRGRTPLEVLASRASAGRITLEARTVERGLFEDELSDVRATLPGGAVVRAREATLSRSPLREPSLRTPALEVILSGDPIEAHALLGKIVPPEGLRVVASRVSVHYRDRAVGSLLLDGVSSLGPESLRAETLELFGARFSDVSLSFKKRRATLEIALGADRESRARATATYVPSDGRAAEWRIVLPHQPLEGLRTALGLGAAPPEEATRVAGTVSFILPDDPAFVPRGSCRLVLDGWSRPPWPDAAALTGSSGSLALVVRPSPVPGELGLERVEVAAALFELRGSGTLALGTAPKVSLQASGRRTCAELARGLPASSHRDAVSAYLAGAAGRRTKADPAGESVELSLRVELEFGVRGDVRFWWHLSPGCGLPEMTTEPTAGR
jgi:hypothetical protein